MADQSEQEQRAGVLLGMGIDTGGSYTDCVILDLNTNELILTTKSHTTPYDLSVGILNSIDKVFEQGKIKGEDIKLVSVSTTLATNSILQNKGWDVGTILIGYQPDAASELKIEKAFIKGGHDLMGEVIEPLDEQAVRIAVENMASKVKAFAVSAYFGCRNPEHEERTRKIIKEMTGLPVVCGHEMSPQLGMFERTTTAYLNARLLPIIKEFLDKMKASLKERNINAPLKVVKSDGSLTSEEIACERPVETMLSGPAASAVGAGVLSKLKDYLVVDIGGTSTDIGRVSEGNCLLDPEGASVGDWRTRVRALSMRTIGLAGDSRIWINNGCVRAGPERVVPLCLAAKKYSKLAERIEYCKDTDFFIAHNAGNAQLEETEQEVFNAIEKLQPVTFEDLICELSKPKPLIQSNIKKLKAQYVIEGCGLTPTDLFHYQGTYVEWDAEVAKKGVATLASIAKITPDELVSTALNFVYRNVAKEVIKKLLFDEIESSQPLCDICNYLLDKSVSGKKDLFGFKAWTDYPIVAVGGSVGLLMPPVCERLGTKLVLPPYYEVGNAVGAISGLVMETATLQIVPKEEGVVIFGLNVPVLLKGDEALDFAKKEATRIAMEKAERVGIREPHIKTLIKPMGEKARVLFYQLGETLSQEDVESAKETIISCGSEVIVTVIGKPAVRITTVWK